MSKLQWKWANFGYQTQEIRTSIVFGAYGENVIIVLKNDEVLALGRNQKGCLGTGVQGEVKELKRIENLCGQRIEGIECGVCAADLGSFCMFAISGSGSVFSWGENDDGQLGLGNSEETVSMPTKISGFLRRKRVVQVACGGYHTLALTSEGEVYGFGWNCRGQLGLGITANFQCLNPQKVGGLLDGKIVASVACQNFSSSALLHSGEIFSWGDNRYGRLSASSTPEEVHSPCKVVGLEKVVISKIACGDCFILALSEDGEVFSWGSNDRRQLRTTNGIMRPAIISTEVEKVRDIAVTSYERDLCACAAITEENKVYIWARCGGQNVWEPILTLCSSLDELFTGNASPPAITYQHLQLQITNLESKTKCPIIKRLQESFDKPETADFAFIVEGKKIHVHKNLLIFGSDVFKNLFLGDWKDSCQKEMVVEDHSYDAFYAFLKYFYTDEVDFTPELALEVFAVAHFYRVMDLMEECEKILKTGLTVQNAAAVFEKAILFGAKDLCKFCFEFCQRHLAYVVNNFVSDDCKREVFLEVFRQAAIQKNKK